MKLTPKEQTLLESGQQILPHDYYKVIDLYRHVRNSLVNVQSGTPVWTFYMNQANQLRDYACVVHKSERENDNGLCYQFSTTDVNFAKYMHAEMRYAAENFEFTLHTGGDGYVGTKLEIVLEPCDESDHTGLQNWIEDQMSPQITAGRRWPAEIHGLYHTTFDVEVPTTLVTDVDSAGDPIPVKP